MPLFIRMDTGSEGAPGQTQKGPAFRSAFSFLQRRKRYNEGQTFHVQYVS